MRFFKPATERKARWQSPLSETAQREEGGAASPGHPTGKANAATTRSPPSASRHRPPPVPLSLAAAAPASAGNPPPPPPRQPLPALQAGRPRPGRGQRRASGCPAPRVGLGGGTGRDALPVGKPPLRGAATLSTVLPPPAPRQPRAGLPAAAPVSLRIAPPRCGTEDAQPATNGRRGKGRGEKRRRAAGQGPPGAHPGQGWAGLAASPGRRLPLAESRPTRPSAPRHVTGVTPPAPPAPSAARTFPLPPRLTAGPLTRAEGNRAAPACAAGRRLRSLRPRLPLPPGPPNFLAGNSR